MVRKDGKYLRGCHSKVFVDGREKQRHENLHSDEYSQVRYELFGPDTARKHVQYQDVCLLSCEGERGTSNEADHRIRPSL